MTSLVLLQLALQVLAALVVGWIVGDWLLDRFFVRSLPEAHAVLGLPERALVGLVAFFGCTVVAMVANLVTGGAVFGLPVIVPLSGAAVILFGVRRKAWVRGVPWLFLSLFLLVLLWLYVRPFVDAGSGARLGDPQWHLGWTEQLLHGEAIPTGPAPEFARNAYPWGYHALLATLVRFVPGSSALTALDASGILILIGIPLAGACLARRVRSDAGWFAAVAVSLIGGFGWISARGPAFAASPSQAHHGADLVVASPNAVYELFPPALPRELGLITLAAAGLFVLIAAALAMPGDGATRWWQGASSRYALGAGVAGGITGLISVPFFLTIVVWVAAAAAFAPRGVKVRLLLTFLAAAVPVFALWAGPVAADYLSFGGFVNVTPHVGTEWALGDGLASWGIVGPAAGAGLILLLVQRSVRSRILLAFVLASAALMALALARPAFDWHLAGNRTLLYQGRVWPPAHLLGATLAGVAAAAAYSWLRARTRVLAAGAAIVLTAVGAASPALASVRLDRLLPTYDKGFIFSSPDFAPDGFVRQAAAHLGPSDVVLVHGSNILAFSIFSFSGARLGAFDDPTLRNNDLRIRFPDLAARWDERMAHEGFHADYAVAQADEAGLGLVVARGLYQGTEYVLTRSS